MRIYSFVCAILLLFVLVGEVSAHTLLVYPTSDAEIIYQTHNSTFSYLRNGVTGIDTRTSQEYCRILSDLSVNKYFQIQRWGASYNTSSLGSSATITGVKFGWKNVQKSNGLGAISINVTTFTPANYTAVNAVANYNKFGNTSLGGWAYADVSTNWNNATITNFNIINKTGYTGIGLRISPDINNNESELTWTSSTTAYSGFRPSVKAYAANSTFLEITYTIPNNTPPAS